MNNRLGDGQAQARTIGVQLLARLVCPKEAVEQAGDHLRIDGRSGVDDIHGGSVQVPLDVHDHPLAWWGVANGVGQEIAERPAQHQPVAGDLRSPNQLQSDLLFFSKSQINNTGYANPKVDDLLVKARGEKDPTTRLGLYQQAEQIIMDDAVWIPLFHQKQFYLVKPYVKDYTVPPMVVPIMRYVSIEK